MALFQKARLIKKQAIIDEGFFQIIHTIFEHKKSRKQLFNILEKIPKPEILIIFDIEENLRLKRLKNNKNLRERLFGKNYFNVWHEVMRYNNREIKAYTKNKSIKNYVLNSTNIEELDLLSTKLKNGK